MVHNRLTPPSLKPPSLGTRIAGHALALAGAALATFAVWSLAWRSHACAEMALFNMKTPASEVSDYLVRRIAFESVRSFSDYLGEFIIMIFGFVFVTLGWRFARGWPEHPTATSATTGGDQR